ncbi:hypothetical protein ACFVHB_04515 [Kitasatospora sp. NPDC127111]|uniref:hypothetical protein n=1 Tax=Kitasatospora sp. NPDC127111 TaxID=3345363 RepID=UPI00363EBD34
MLLLGLLLMAASGAFVGLLIADNLSGGPEYQVTVLGNDLVTLNSLAIFLSGVALALIFCLGLALAGLARRARRPVRPGADLPAGQARYERPGPVTDERAVGPAEPYGRAEPAERPAEPVPPARAVGRDAAPAGQAPTAARARPEEPAAAGQGGQEDVAQAPERPRGRIRQLFDH